MFRSIWSFFRYTLFSREFWRIVLEYPGIVAEAVRLGTEPPVKFRGIDLRVRSETTRQDGRVLIEMQGRPWGLKEPTDFRLAIDGKKKEVDWNYTTDWLFDRQNKGSGAMGLVIMAYPVLWLLSPILKRVIKRRELKEQRYGMSRHAIALLEVLRGDEMGKGLVREDTLQLLEDVFRNEYTWEKKYCRQVGFVEAQQLLNDADLTVVIRAAEDRPLRDEELRSYDWRDDDGEMVAQAQLVDGQLHQMTVLANASWFSEWDEEQWLHLLTCYRSKKEMQYQEAREIHEARKIP